VAHPSEPRFLVLHGLRLKGNAATSFLAERSGLDTGETGEILRSLTAEGLVREHEKRPLPWSLSPAGREEHGRLLAEELEASGARAAVGEAYDRFGGPNEGLNMDVLQLFTDWQVRSEGPPPELNDHSDEAYDREVVERLAGAHVRACAITDGLGAHLERFGRYTPRLGAAMDKIRAGEGDWFTGMTVESYHTVWWELHQDLMTTLGLERAAEEART
jgi:hypothetical protein